MSDQAASGVAAVSELQLNGPVPEPGPAREKPPRRKKAARRARAAVPADETPRQRFLRASQTRMGSALTAIDLIAGFGRNRARYEYDEDEAGRMADRLEEAIGRMRRELARPVSREEERKAERSFGW